MKVLSFILTILLISQLSNAQELSSFTAESNTFFNKYVMDGRVAYKTIKQNLSGISNLYSDIGNMDLSGASDNEKKAFYINAYNLIVIYQVTKYYPLKSPLDKSGFFDKVKHKVAGESLTLNHLEIKKLLLPYKDPRIHFVLACAATSCPPLASFAYKPDNLDEKLEARTKLAINDNNWIQVKNSEKKVLISKIFEWYEKDFTSTGKSLLEWINEYRKTKIPGSYNVGFYEYDWSLNER